MNDQFHAFHPVVENNRAVYLLREGHYENAVQTLGNTLSSLSAFMRNGFENMDATGQFVPLDLSRSGAKFSRQVSGVSSHTPGLENAPPRFVQSPLEVPQDLPVTPQTGEVLSYIVVYNLALSWHLWGMKVPSSEEQTLFLTKALNLYRLSHRIMCSGRVNVGTSHYMALVCNTGNAYLSLGSAERADACFQLLLETLMCVVDQGNQCTCEFLDGFIWNIAPLVLEEQSAPAA